MEGATREDASSGVFHVEQFSNPTASTGDDSPPTPPHPGEPILDPESAVSPSGESQPLFRLHPAPGHCRDSDCAGLCHGWPDRPASYPPGLEVHRSVFHVEHASRPSGCATSRPQSRPPRPSTRTRPSNTSHPAPTNTSAVKKERPARVDWAPSAGASSPPSPGSGDRIAKLPRCARPGRG